MLTFEWDETKSRTNLKKHGISFEEAQSVFFDENALEFADPDHSDEELPTQSVGRLSLYATE